MNGKEMAALCFYCTGALLLSFSFHPQVHNLYFEKWIKVIRDEPECDLPTHRNSDSLTSCAFVHRYVLHRSMALCKLIIPAPHDSLPYRPVSGSLPLTQTYCDLVCSLSFPLPGICCSTSLGIPTSLSLTDSAHSVRLGSVQGTLLLLSL